METDELSGKIIDRTLLKRMFLYTRPYKKLVGGAVLMIIAASMLQLAAPYFTKEAIDIYIKGSNPDGLYSIVFLYIGVLIATFFVQYAGQIPHQCYHAC